MERQAVVTGGGRGSLFSFKECVGGSVKQRGVGVAASVGLSEMGMPSFVLGPGQGSHWKDRFPFSYS